MPKIPTKIPPLKRSTLIGVLALSAAFVAGHEELAAQDPSVSQRVVETAIEYVVSRPGLQGLRVGFDSDRREGVQLPAPGQRIAGLPVLGMSAVRRCEGQGLQERCRFASDVDVLVGSRAVALNDSLAVVEVEVSQAVTGTTENIFGSAYKVHLARQQGRWTVVRLETLWVS